MIKQLFTTLTRFKKDESGAAMVEYAVALIVVTTIGIATMGLIGDNAGTIVDNACDELATEAGASACP